MKKSPIILAIASLGFLFQSCADQGAKNNESAEAKKEEAAKTEMEETVDGVYSVDPENSVVKWEGTMVEMYSHNGTLDFAKGSITIKEGKLVNGELVVDMNSMQPTDDNYNPEEGKTKEKLVSHLKSDEFFLVEKHPYAHFAIGGSESGTVKGEMTIRGKTNTIKIDGFEMHSHGGEVHLTASTTLNRQAYDVAFSHPMEDMVLSDDLEIQVDITATK